MQGFSFFLVIPISGVPSTGSSFPGAGLPARAWVGGQVGGQEEGETGEGGGEAGKRGGARQTGKWQQGGSDASRQGCW